MGYEGPREMCELWWPAVDSNRVPRR